MGTGSGRLAGKRVVITQADDYMGPATADLFTEEGATVIADTRDLTARGACEATASIRASTPIRGPPCCS